MIRDVVKFYGIRSAEQLFYHFGLKDMHKPHVVPPFENFPEVHRTVDFTIQIYTAPLLVQRNTADNDRYQLKKFQIKDYDSPPTRERSYPGDHLNFIFNRYLITKPGEVL